MKRISCDIIRDVLPLYLDGVVSNETKEMVEEHLKNCEACKREAAVMKQDVTLPANGNTRLAEANVLKNLKIKIRRKKFTFGIISAILTVTVIVSCFLFLTLPKLYIPYDSTQFEITELNGRIYACYYGNAFGGSVVHNPVSVEIGEVEKNAVVFYSYRTPLDHIKSRFQNKESDNPYFIHLGNADEIDTIYYGKFNLRNPDFNILDVIQNSELIWRK